MNTFSTYVNLLYPHVSLAPGQVWTDNSNKYTFVCDKHGQYECAANHILKKNSGCQCKGCWNDQDVASAGTKRAPRASKGEKDLAAKLRAEGLSYQNIARQLGRSNSTIITWLDPEYHQKKKQRNAKWIRDNKDRHNACKQRYRSEFQHGKAISREHGAHRRLLMLNVPEFILLDGQWKEVDRKETYRVFSEVLLPANERKAIQELYLEAQFQTEQTGVEHHIDHIWPLSKSGEHVIMNLQILPASENLSKQNKFRLEDQKLFTERLFAS